MSKLISKSEYLLKVNSENTRIMAINILVSLLLTLNRYFTAGMYVLTS